MPSILSEVLRISSFFQQKLLHLQTLTFAENLTMFWWYSFELVELIWRCQFGRTPVSVEQAHHETKSTVEFDREALIDCYPKSENQSL